MDLGTRAGRRPRASNRVAVSLRKDSARGVRRSLSFFRRGSRWESMSVSRGTPVDFVEPTRRWRTLTGTSLDGVPTLPCVRRRFRRRHYEARDGTLEEPPSLPELGRRVFLVLMRAVGPEHASSSSKDTNVNGTTAGGEMSPGQMLVSTSGLLGPSAVLDVCALYGLSNPALVATLIESLGSLDEGTVGVTLSEGLGSAGLAAAGALGEVHAKVAGLQDGVEGPSVGAEESSDLLLYVSDVAVSVGSLLQACSRLKLRGSGKGWGAGGEGPLASRLQGSDGEISPEGLAAALALAFEGSMPILEGVLLSGKSDTEAEVVRARARLARQWLLRCLHFLVGPVFLEPLGLQESAAGEESSGVSRGTATALADGLLRFIVSLSAASGHLAPTGYAGSLLGEYNLRFRLADALEQADVLQSTSSSSSPEVFPLEDVGSIGSERTEYLVGILRGLPVSAEALAARAEAEAAAAEVARKMSAALEKDRKEGSRAAGSSAGYRDGPPADPEELDDMIKAVQAVFGGPEDSGGLGEGFVEACLSVMGWSPQAVIEGVLEDRLPSHVAKLNRKLRRAWRGKKGDLDKAYRVDKELAAAETKRLVDMEKRQEEDAYLLSKEYDDDYDDQYDDREVDVGGGGPGALGDMETVRRVNQLLRDDEEEDAWWERNKNTNLSFAGRGSGGWRGGVNDQSDAADEGKDDQGGDGGDGGGSDRNVGNSGRGRGRGAPGSRGSFGGGGRGRGRGRGREGRGGRGGGGGGGQGPQDGSDGGSGGGGTGKDSDRLQQRRKGVNKAMVGNHNRKNAARKKESRGMF